MNRSLYKQNILDHYKNPRNRNELSSFTHHSFVVNRSCGDEVDVWLRVENEKVEEIGYQVRGCAICIAAASMLSQELEGKDLDNVIGYEEESLLEIVGMQKGAGRVKCALLPLDAIRTALRS